MTNNVKAFMKANDESFVVEGKVTNLKHGGATCRLRDGRKFNLSVDEVCSLPASYPKWGF